MLDKLRPSDRVIIVEARHHSTIKSLRSKLWWLVLPVEKGFRKMKIWGTDECGFVCCGPNFMFQILERSFSGCCNPPIDLKISLLIHDWH